MNQSISNALLFNIVIIFVIVLIAFFVGSLSYSKASKVKNRIIEEIEKYGEAAQGDYSTKQNGIENAYKDAEPNILNWLRNGDDGNSTGIGYRQVREGTKTCPTVNAIANETSVSAANGGVTMESSPLASSENPYEYCVYKIKKCDSNKSCYTYFRVITYMYFDVPIIEDLVKIPVTGETMGFQIVDS